MRAWLVGLSVVFAITALAQPASELERAYDEMLAAQTALQRAEAQKRLDEEVERARQRLQQALERWNAVR